MQQVEKGRRTRLALLADTSRDTARDARPLLWDNGLELVHARAGLAALELLQRMRQSFALAVISLHLPDLPGVILIETLRLFRPRLPIICLASETSPTYPGLDCALKPLERLQFALQVAAAMEGRASPVTGLPLPAEARARAQASFAVTGSLVEAARELSRGMPPEETAEENSSR